MTDFLKKHFHTGHLKALLIALPVTAFYGMIILYAFDRSLGTAITCFMEQDKIINRCVLNYSMLVGAPLAALGLTGAWMAFLLQRRLDKRMGLLNKSVSFLLVCGAIGAFIATVTGLYFIGFSQFTKMDPISGLLFFIPSALTLYAIFIIRRVLHMGKWQKQNPAEEKI